MTIVETWNPRIDGLDAIRVKRHLPFIKILLSKEALDKDVNGYQVRSFAVETKNKGFNDMESYSRSGCPHHVACFRHSCRFCVAWYMVAVLRDRQAL